MTAQIPEGLRAMTGLVVDHCLSADYALAPTAFDDSERLTFKVTVPGDRMVRFELDGEMFQLFFPGGYTWAECGHTDEDAKAALVAVLEALDAYADPGSREVQVKRFLRPSRRELHLSNGASLRPTVRAGNGH